MDHADDGDTNDVFVYMGGDQRVPRDVTHVRVHKSVNIIPRRAFYLCRKLVSIEMHDGVEIIEKYAFFHCWSLKRIKLSGVRVIKASAFNHCLLVDVEFGDKLETIGKYAFQGTRLRKIKLPKVRFIASSAFQNCYYLTDADLSEDLKRIQTVAFESCSRLRRIAVPLKNNLIGGTVFSECKDLSHVDLVGGIHKTIASLLFESWRNEMNDEIDRINRDLPITGRYVKSVRIQQWMERVIRRIDHYKNEQYTLLKEFTTLLELDLWKAKIDEDKRCIGGDQLAKKAKIDMKTARQEQRIKSGASIVIKNVLPFVKLE